MHDQEQHEVVVVEILTYRGDHNERSNLQFLVKLQNTLRDGDILEQNYRAARLKLRGTADEFLR
jgi:hypothetical protein